IFIRSKYNQLLNFSLNENLLENNITSQNIQIFDNNLKRYISIKDLIEIIKGKRYFGRIQITGDNGSGKSSLIKILKDYETNSVLISPETDFHFQESKSSTGQKQLEKINFFLQENFDVVFLDEWSANLDKNNINKIDDILENASRNKLLIEIIHRN
uniref:ATP-binding cassette domain-containing protein n=1 Tax=uncultured Psychrobacter sp. TaxID=259303 RepID=UPI002598840E